MRQLDSIASIWELFRVFRVASKYEGSSPLDNYPSIKTLVSGNLKRDIPKDSLDDYLLALQLEFENFNPSELDNYTRFADFVRFASESNKKSSYIERINSQRENSLDILKKMWENLSKDADLISYARESITQTLLVEFAHQVQPIKAEVDHSRIDIVENDSVYFKLKIIDNRVIDEGTPVFLGAPSYKIYLIDDPYILDDFGLSRPLGIRYQDNFMIDSVLNPDRIYNHQNKLKFVIRTPKQPSILEQRIISESLKEVNEKISSMIPGNFQFSSEGEYYIERGKKLRISNLATGSKLFAILKILLEKGEITDKSILVFDEPEAHLHPAWQNAFAEIITLLVKEVGVRILLTTHSPNFVLAIDAYMRKYDISDRTNFYQTIANTDGFVRYECVNDDIGAIYQDFLTFLSEVKVIRDHYLTKREK